MLGSDLSQLDGYPFAVRHSKGAVRRATAAADLAAAAYAYFRRLFSGTAPDMALIVVGEEDWPAVKTPYGLPFFSDDPGWTRPGVVVMPADGGGLWTAIAQDIRDASPRGYARLLTAYPDGAGGVNLQPFFDLITIHELGHAFESFGKLNLPTFWLSEIFANLAMHTFVATQLSTSLPTLETLPSVGAGSRRLAARMRAEGYSTLEELQAHYTGGDDPMSPLNYAWFQYRWMRLSSAVFATDGELALTRLWNCFQSPDRANASAPSAASAASAAPPSAASLAPLLSAEVSSTLGRALRAWR